MCKAGVVICCFALACHGSRLQINTRANRDSSNRVAFHSRFAGSSRMSGHSKAIFGSPPAEQAKELQRIATDYFEQTFGCLPTAAAHAPGRVNIIGEHVDYNGGFVLPMALDKRTVVVGKGEVVNVDVSRPCRVVSLLGLDEPQEAIFDANPATLEPGMPAWANYVKGVVKQNAADLPPGKKFAFDAVFASNVPIGAGVSSSAALEVSSALLVEHFCKRRVAPEERALRCQAAEHQFAGVPCGIMDQFVSILAEDGHLLEIDCRSNSGRAVPLTDEDIVVLVANSNVKHELSNSEYPIRVAQCNEAVCTIKKEYPQIKDLRDVTLEMLSRAQGDMAEVVYRRARHVITENLRVQQAVKALQDQRLDIVGEAMLKSHASLRDDYEVSTKELDKLVELAMGFGGGGVIGSRMTGGGFGGCTVTLVSSSVAEALADHICIGYKAATGLDADVFVTRPGPGADTLPPMQ